MHNLREAGEDVSYFAGGDVSGSRIQYLHWVNFPATTDGIDFSFHRAGTAAELESGSKQLAALASGSWDFGWANANRLVRATDRMLMFESVAQNRIGVISST